MSSHDSQETLADRLNSEPVILRGSSSSELVMIVTVAFAVWLPISAVVALLAGRLMLTVGLTGLMVVASVWFGSTWFQKIKRGRPDFYYQHRILLFIDQMGWRRCSLIHRTGRWSLGRQTHYSPRHRSR